MASSRTNFEFLNYLPLVRTPSKQEAVTISDTTRTSIDVETLKPKANFDIKHQEVVTISHSTTSISVENFNLNQKARFDIKLWDWSLAPWFISVGEKIQSFSTINKKLKKHAQRRGVVENPRAPLRFRPYVSKVPWHTGPRALLSQLFPRYGHYCGPNWSSGKAGGSPLWDRRPVDWLDFCCYCHDVGYDTHDQAKLLEADLAFAQCLERQHGAVKGDPYTAHFYKTMCLTGLKNILIPYRSMLIKLQAGQPLTNFSWLSNGQWTSWRVQKANV